MIDDPEIFRAAKLLIDRHRGTPRLAMAKLQRFGNPRVAFQAGRDQRL
jgi:hypothetical protein